MFILTTAGHIDHGKSALIEVLTGKNPMHLEEELRRGMTIDLAFSYLTIEGKTIGIIDVPGHNRLIKNTVAGAGGVAGAILAISAKEGWKPQTEEHLNILFHLGIKEVIPVITMADLASETEIERVADETARRLLTIGLSTEPPIVFSALDGRGKEELLKAISSMSERGEKGKGRAGPALSDRDYLKEHQDISFLRIGKMRLHIDRVFSKAGYGTVVTGTLLDGALEKGQLVKVLPTSEWVKVRRLEIVQRETDSALPPTRLAVNLDASKELFERGKTLVSDRRYEAHKVFYALIRTNPIGSWKGRMKEIKSNKEFRILIGTDEVIGRLQINRILDDERAYARIVFRETEAARCGMRFVIRTINPPDTAAGGEVLFIPWKGFEIRGERVAELLDGLMEKSPESSIAAIIKVARYIESMDYLFPLPFSDQRLQEALKALEKDGVVIFRGESIISKEYLDYLERRVKETLSNYHDLHPDEKGATESDLTKSLGFKGRLFNILPLITERRGVENVWGKYRLAGFTPVEAAETREQREEALGIYLKDPWKGPMRKIFIQKFPRLRKAFDSLVRDGELIIFAEGAVLPKQVVEDLKSKIVAEITKEGQASIARLREISGASRKYLIPILEELDREGKTVRLPDGTRVLAREGP